MEERIYFCVVSLIALVLARGEHLPINWTEASVVPPEQETHTGNPAAIPLAPCPCDLTANLCDTHCCCDKECTATALDAFSCLLGEEKITSPSCRYRGPYSPEWSSFLCLVRENTPYLGLFYHHQQAIRDFQTYLARVRQPHYSYQDTEIHTPEQEYQPHYVLGAEVATGVDMGGTVLQGALSLPQMVLEGVCVDTFPIRFLENFSHRCPSVMSPERCETDAGLDAASYLLPVDKVASAPLPSTLQVIGNLSAGELVSAEVEYECLSDITGFIKVREGGVHIPPAEGQSKCDGSNSPHLNTTTGLCVYVVLSVEYLMRWEGPVITQVHVRVTLGSVPTITEASETADATSREHTIHPTHSPPSTLPQVFLLQHFAVKFLHTVSSSTNTSDIPGPEGNESGVPELLERSGSPGYLVGWPLLAGYAVYNTSTEQEENSTLEGLPSVALNTSTGLYIWRPDSSGECHQSSLEKVNFGVDSLSSCRYTWSDVFHCSELRELLEEVLFSLVQADVVSILGWANTTSEEDFLPIIIDLQEENLSSSGVCEVPVSLEYRIIYQDIVDIPSPMLAIHQVVGAGVRLHYETFHFPDNNTTTTTTTGSTLLTSSALFSQHPRPSGLSRFWEAMEDRWCEGGTCWRELLWPWTHSMEGAGLNHGLDTCSYTTHLAFLLTHTFLGLLLFLPALAATLAHGRWVLC